jgi:NO-binding membrane sensor protein with MHYT domain
MSIIEDKNVYGKTVSISHRKKHLLYLFLMAISLGGVGIWGMHYIGMHAFTLKDNDLKKVEVMYNEPLMATSFLAIVAMTFAGLLISCYDPMFSKTKAEILEQFIEDSKRLSLKEIRKISYRQVLLIITTKELGHLLTGGLVMGSGMIIAHYIGMMALVFDGHIIWKPGFVAFSVLVALIASVFAYWMVFRLLSIFPEQELLRLGASVVFAIAATGMHYIGMLAAHYRFSTNLEETIHDSVLQQHVKEEEAYQDILIASVVLMWAMAIMIMWTSRAVIIRQTKIIRQADSILYKIAAETASNSSTSFGSGSGGSGHHAPNAIRNMVEEYVTKRCRAYALQRRPQVSGAEGSIVLEKEQQQNMGFVEYMVHMVLLLMTCQWKKLWLAVRMEVDSSVGGSSRHSDASEDRSETAGANGAVADDSAVSGAAMHEMAELLWTTRKSQNHDSMGNGSRRTLRVSIRKTVVEVIETKAGEPAEKTVADAQILHTTYHQEETRLREATDDMTTEVPMLAADRVIEMV